MPTHRDTIEFILDKLGDRERFTTRAMFGEYALYAEGRTVALVCDDLLYVKIMPASAELAPLYETSTPYPGAKPHYIVTEDLLDTLHYLPELLCDVARALPEPKVKQKKRGRRGGKKSLDK
jgi:TfoX/Sxy family transcriptional regulator of competence genes